MGVVELTFKIQQAKRVLKSSTDYGDFYYDSENISRMINMSWSFLISWFNLSWFNLFFYFTAKKTTSLQHTYIQRLLIMYYNTVTLGD